MKSGTTMDRPESISWPIGEIPPWPGRRRGTTSRKLRGEVVMPWLAADPVIVLPVTELLGENVVGYEASVSARDSRWPR